jgi:16S rRNA (guanine966-N2)-methyltransferase
VAGELGGRRLVAPRGDRVRPTADRVREAIFSILGDVSGAGVLDLYSGTGALAIEALSRGAESAVLVDTDLAAARRNVEALGIGDRAELVRADVLRHLRRDDREYDLVFCDPPYGLAPELGPRLETLVPPASPGERA